MYSLLRLKLGCLLAWGVCMLSLPTAWTQSTPTEWQAEAVRRYPELGESGSAFNRSFVEAVTRARAEEPQLFQQPSWPLVLAERIATGVPPSLAPPPMPAAGVKSAAASEEPVGQALEQALVKGDPEAILQAAIQFAHPVSAYRAQLTDLARRLEAAHRELAQAERVREQNAPEIARLERNAEMAGQPNRLSSSDFSGQVRAREMRRQAQAMIKQSADAIESASDKILDLKKEMQEAVVNIRAADAAGQERLAAAKTASAQQQAAEQAQMAKVAEMKQLVDAMKEPEGRPYFAEEKVTPTYDETLNFINTKLVELGWSLRYGEKSKKFLLRHPSGAYYLEFGLLSPVVKVASGGEGSAIQMEVSRREVAIRAVGADMQTAQEIRKVRVPCADAIDAEKLARAFRHLILMSGAKEDLF